MSFYLFWVSQDWRNEDEEMETNIFYEKSFSYAQA